MSKYRGNLLRKNGLTPSITSAKGIWTLTEKTKASITDSWPLNFINTAIPTISGTAQARQTLTASTGTWSILVDSYSYQWQKNSGGWTNISGATASTYVVTSSDVGVPIRVIVTASRAPLSPVSATSNATSNVTANVPLAPTIGTATAVSSSSATVAYTAPTDNGGATITSYTITSSPGNITASGTANPLTITGLSSFTAYTFTVKANNSAGSSAASASSNSIVTPAASGVPIQYLIVAGGGGGGGYYGSGGGGGGVITSASFTFPTGSTQTVTVGAGGVVTSGVRTGGNGGNSVLGPLVAIGGGGGAGLNSTAGSGGSGGGAAYVSGAPNAIGIPGKGTAGQGYDGGLNYSVYGAGGGGAGGVGGNAVSGNAGDGGAGISSSITGTTVTYGGGGGGRAYGLSGYGTDGGGNGGTDNADDAGNGAANRGGGGGGSDRPTRTNGNGGSGIVVVKYADTYAAATTTGSPTYTVSGGFRTYIYNASGTIRL